MTLISPEALQDRLGDPNLRIADVRWWLNDRAKGRRDYVEAHLPGAVFVDLDADLAAPPGPGRHPLPSPGAFAGRMARARVRRRQHDRRLRRRGRDDRGQAVVDARRPRPCRRPPARRRDPGLERDRWRADGGRAGAAARSSHAARRLVADDRAGRPRGAAGRRRRHRCAGARALSRRGRAGRRHRRAHPDGGQPPQRRQPRPRRPVPRRGCAAGAVRAARGRHRVVLRQRRDRVPQRARDPHRRSPGSPHLRGLVQRLDPGRAAGCDG